MGRVARAPPRLGRSSPEELKNAMRSDGASEPEFVSLEKVSGQSLPKVHVLDRETSWDESDSGISQLVGWARCQGSAMKGGRLLHG